MRVMQAAGSTRKSLRPATAVKSAARVLDVLELLSASSAGLTFIELREALNLPKSSLYMLLGTMLDRDYVSLEGEARRYRIGIRTWEAGHAFIRSRDLADLAHSYLRAVRDELQETAQLAILDGLENVYIAKEDCDRPLRLVSAVGRRLPAHATGLGKVLLAFLPPVELSRRLDAAGPLPRLTERTITEPEHLFRNLGTIRERKYAVDDGECTVGVYCVAVPIYDHTGSVTAAMSCTVPSARLDEHRMLVEPLLHVLRVNAAGLSKALGAPSTVLLERRDDNRVVAPIAEGDD